MCKNLQTLCAVAILHKCFQLLLKLCGLQLLRNSDYKIITLISKMKKNNV